MTIICIQNATSAANATDANSTSADKPEPIRVEVQEPTEDGDAADKKNSAEDSAKAEEKAPVETDEEL
jgi:hypothetical protein